MMPKTLTAQLALEGIHIEITQQNFEKPGAGNAPDELAAAAGTF
jgi:hypothetical protein